ncbi:MAG: hypothetical protein ACRC9L_07965 [Brevinema sp.]
MPSYFSIGLAVFTVGLILFSFKLYRRIRHLEKNLFSYQRVLEQKTSILDSVVSQIASALPPDLNPQLREKRLLHLIEDLVQNFSIKLNKTTHEQISLQNDIWNEKFSSLLKVLGKDERDLIKTLSTGALPAWTSIVDLRQKSQLLFDDMKEDGIFYRIQSLWLLGNLCFAQSRNVDAWRHYIAGIRLFKESSPKLPLTKNLMWKLADDILLCIKQLPTRDQMDGLNKFHVLPEEIALIFIELNKTDSHPDSLQKIRSWSHNMQNR